MATGDFLDEKRREIDARLSELKPLVDEYARLQAGAAALDGLPQATPVAAARNGAPPPPPARTRGASHGKRGRPRGSGKRGAQALALITANPGITVAEIAANMDIKQKNYLYRVLRGLAENKRVVKDGIGWKAVDAA